MQYISDFKDALAAAGYATDSDIKADDRLNRAHRVGDKQGKNDIRYRLAVDGAFAFGWFIYQGGERHDWHSKGQQLTAAEAAAQKAKIDAQRKASARERKGAQEAAAARAEGMWRRAVPANADHPYLVRKGVAPGPCRERAGVLLVPMYNTDGVLCSLQFISATGDKRYLKDGAKGTLRLAGSETVALCEGYSTGWTVHAATGWTVEVCFDTAGLKARAGAGRVDVICADDDQWVFRAGRRPTTLGDDKSSWPAGDDPVWTEWRKNGLLYNPGFEAATAALNKVGGTCRLVDPKFKSTSSRPTDFNDLQALEGLDAVREQLVEDPLPEMSAEEQAAYAESIEYMNLVPDDVTAVAAIKNDDSWRKQLLMVQMTNKETKEKFMAVEPKSQNNIYLITRYSEVLRGMFILNEFSRRKMVVRCPPWENLHKFKPRDVRDNDYTRVCMELERLQMKPSVDRVTGAVESICHDRSFHPVQKYFSSLKWDGSERLKNWLTFYLGAEKDPASYLSGIGTKWMVAAVARIFQPGCKFDHMLVLEGTTDIGKSAALRKLATFHGEEYFYDGMTFANIGDKDTMLNIQGSLIIEFPELSSLQSREVEDVKQWITMQEDRGRKPYGKEPVVYPRQFVLAGSTNNSEYLKDATGNKRFWPVLCGERLDLKSLEADRGQLWAEAVHLYKGGYQWWIPDGDELVPLTRKVQAKRMVTHPWEDAVAEFTKLSDFVTVNDILINKIKKELKDIKRGDEMAVAAILKSLGFISKNDGKRRGWERVNIQHKMEGI